MDQGVIWAGGNSPWGNSQGGGGIQQGGGDLKFQIEYVHNEYKNLLVFYKKAVLKNLSIFTRKQLC